jgi:DNA-binding CsgD family transcriptional regulator
MENLEHYIEHIESSETPEEAFSRFCSIMAEYGYNKVTYSLLTDHPSLGLPRQHGLANSYPEDWMKHYSDRGYIQIDPVVQRCMCSQKPFFWSELTSDTDLPEAPRRLMDEAEEAGLRGGVAIPLRGLPGEIVGVGFARDASYKDKEYEFLSVAHLLSVVFHETYRHMLQVSNNINLTVREGDILCWAAEGKSDDEIAIILNISANTVRFHWKNIFNKLDAHGRIYAVTKAMRLQLIIPGLTRHSYQNW